jgi:ankyrin repeat protein/Ca2+-binding EF-hand superfamily protein
MGATASNIALAAPFSKIGGWTHADVRKILATFKELQLSTSLDYEGLQHLVTGAYLVVEAEVWSRDILRAFGGARSGRMLALAFISGAALCAKGKSGKTIDLIFRIFDVRGDRKLSFNELLILLINVSAGLSIMTGGAGINAKFVLSEPQAQAIAEEVFAMFSRNEARTISADEFEIWARTWVRPSMSTSKNPSRVDITLPHLLSKLLLAVEDDDAKPEPLLPLLRPSTSASLLKSSQSEYWQRSSAQRNEQDLILSLSSPMGKSFGVSLPSPTRSSSPDRLNKRQNRKRVQSVGKDRTKGLINQTRRQFYTLDTTGQGVLPKADALKLAKWVFTRKREIRVPEARDNETAEEALALERLERAMSQYKEPSIELSEFIDSMFAELTFDELINQTRRRFYQLDGEGHGILPREQALKLGEWVFERYSTLCATDAGTSMPGKQHALVSALQAKMHQYELPTIELNEFVEVVFEQLLKTHDRPMKEQPLVLPASPSARRLRTPELGEANIRGQPIHYDSFEGLQLEQEKPIVYPIVSSGADDESADPFSVEEDSGGDMASAPAAQEAPRQEAEELARTEAGEKVRKEAEEPVRKEVEEEVRKEAKEQARKEVEEEVRKEVEEEVRKEAKEQVKKEAKEQARKEMEEQVRKEVEEQARKEATEQAKKEVEEKAKQEAEEEAKKKVEGEKAKKAAEDQAKKDALEQVQKATEKQTKRDTKEQAKKGVEEQAKPEDEEQVRKEVEDKRWDEIEQEAKRQSEHGVRLSMTKKANAAERSIVEAEERIRKEVEERVYQSELCAAAAIIMQNGVRSQQARTAALEQHKKWLKGQYRDTFMRMDVGNSGYISREEHVTLYRKAGANVGDEKVKQGMRAQFDSVDLDRDGRISCEDFVQAQANKKFPLLQDEAMKKFEARQAEKTKKMQGGVVERGGAAGEAERRREWAARATTKAKVEEEVREIEEIEGALSQPLAQRATAEERQAGLEADINEATFRAGEEAVARVRARRKDGCQPEEVAAEQQRADDDTALYYTLEQQRAGLITGGPKEAGDAEAGDAGREAQMAELHARAAALVLDVDGTATQSKGKRRTPTVILAKPSSSTRDDSRDKLVEVAVQAPVKTQKRMSRGPLQFDRGVSETVSNSSRRNSQIGMSVSPSAISMSRPQSAQRPKTPKELRQQTRKLLGEAAVAESTPAAAVAESELVRDNKLELERADPEATACWIPQGAGVVYDGTVARLEQAQLELDSQLLHAAWQGDADGCALVLAPQAATGALLLTTSMREAMTVDQLKVMQVARVDSLDMEGNTPLMGACTGGSVACVDHLLDIASDGMGMVLLQNCLGDTALMGACWEGHAAVVQKLLRFWDEGIGDTVCGDHSTAGGMLHQRNAAGETALVRAAWRGHTKCVELLLQARSSSESVNVQSVSGDTALMGASMEGHVEVVKMLLDAGASVDAANSDDDTALLLACTNSHKETVELLLASGADLSNRCSDSIIDSADGGPDDDGRSAMIQAVCNGNGKDECAILELLLRSTSSSGADSIQADCTAVLMWAAWNAREDCLKLLVQYRVDLWTTNAAGETALMRAAWRGHAQTMQLLLEAASPQGKGPQSKEARSRYANTSNNDGDTALLCSCWNGHDECVRLLLQHGADPTATNHAGDIPLQVLHGLSLQFVSTLIASILIAAFRERLTGISKRAHSSLGIT